MAPPRMNGDVKRGSGRNGKRENKREERRDKCVVTDDGTHVGGVQVESSLGHDE